MLPQWSPQAMANIILKHKVYARIYGEGETFVMVEGKTDEVLWEEFRSREDCKIYPVNGKDRVVETLDMMTTRDSRGVAGIVDADYWLITDAAELGAKNLLYDADCSDMEMILLGSPALKKILRHELPDIDIDAVHGFADLLYRESQSLAAEIGYFRWLNEVQRYGLNFKAFIITDFVDAEERALDREWLARRLADGRDGVSSERLLRETAELRENNPPDLLQLCRGKDVVAIMAHIMPALYETDVGEALPESAAAIFQAGRLAKELRKAYELIYFKRTSLFRRIQKWECTNSPHKILKPAD